MSDATALPRLVAVDLDGTMLGDSVALTQLNSALSEARPRLSIAYVTGRTFGSARALLEESTLLPPDFLVTDVGGSIRSAPTWREQKCWRKQLSTGWRRGVIRSVASLYAPLQLQPPENQGDFKVSFFLPERYAGLVLPLLSNGLRRRKLAAKLIYSSGRDLDILPAQSGKGQAVSYLASRLGAPPHCVFTCGDSGNDYEMLTCGFCSAAVANAQPELLRKLPKTVYRAPKPYAAGVMQGLTHYGFL